jgi:hypothetical protein
MNTTGFLMFWGFTAGSPGINNAILETMKSCGYPVEHRQVHRADER